MEGGGEVVNEQVCVYMVRHGCVCVGRGTAANLAVPMGGPGTRDSPGEAGSHGVGFVRGPAAAVHGGVAQSAAADVRVVAFRFGHVASIPRWRRRP